MRPERATRPPRLLPRLLNAPQPLSYASSLPGSAPVLTPMNPLDRLFVWLWDHTGERRREQKLRLVRTRRKGRQHDAAHDRALVQIRRTQELAQRIGGDA